MTIRRRCRGPCKSARRCLEHLWFDVTCRGERYRMPVNDYAVPRMEPGSQRLIESMEEAKDWERRFIGDVKAGRDPRVAPQTKLAPLQAQHVAAFLDAYYERHLKPAGIRSLDSAAGRIKALKRHVGDLPIKALEDPDIVNGFKIRSDYARRVQISTLHKALAILRAAIRWGQAQRPPLIDKSPFHRFGVRLNIKAETMRDRRLSLAAILKRRGALGPAAFVFGGPDGESQACFRTAWESLLLRANGHETTRGKPHGRVDRAKLRQIDLHWHDLRHEGACRLLADGVDIRIIQLMLGHASVQQTQRYLNVTDEELRKGLEISWQRRTLRAVEGGANA